MLKFIITSLVLLLSLHSFGQTGDLSPIFDLSPDGEKIVVAVSEGEFSQLYQYAFKDHSITPLTNNKKEYHSRPVYSPSGNKVLFLSKSSTNQQSDLYLLDIASKTVTKLTKGETYVTEAVFSPKGDKIIYCGAGYLGSYSPIARKAPHDLDLFSIQSDGKGFKKLTDLSAYSLSSLSLSQSGDTVMCSLTEKELDGIYLLSLSDTTVRQKIEAVNNPRPQIGNFFYSNPMYAPNFKSLSFIAPYQLYTLGLHTKECQEVWSTFGKEEQAMPIFSRFFKSGDQLIFSILKIENRQYARSAELLIVDLKTKKTTKVEMK